MLNWLKQHSVIGYFILAYLISWMIWSPIVASEFGWVKWNVPYELYYFGSFGPMIAALILTALIDGKQGVSNLFRRVVKWRVEFKYYVFAVLVPIGLFAIAYLVNWLITGTWSNLRQLGQADYLSNRGPFAVLVIWLLTYGLGEETGWRGFALPRLQKNRTAASATLILSLLWAGWHFPAFFFRDTYIELGLFGFPMFVIMMIFTTMVFTWLYNSTRGSIFIVIVFHAIFNWLSVSEAGGQFVQIIMSVPIVFWSIYVARRYGQENVAPIERQVA